MKDLKLRFAAKVEGELYTNLYSSRGIKGISISGKTFGGAKAKSGYCQSPGYESRDNAV